MNTLDSLALFGCFAFALVFIVILVLVVVKITTDRKRKREEIDRRMEEASLERQRELSRRADQRVTNLGRSLGIPMRDLNRKPAARSVHEERRTTTVVHNHYVAPYEEDNSLEMAAVGAMVGVALAGDSYTPAPEPLYGGGGEFSGGGASGSWEPSPEPERIYDSGSSYSSSDSGSSYDSGSSCDSGSSDCGGSSD